MTKTLSFLLAFLVLGCAEKLMEKPENLIAKERMIDILEDMAILNAAKSTNVGILRENKIEPMGYIFNKYGVDSVQFVESDRYYASLPDEYELIYKDVAARLEKTAKLMADTKKINDSIKLKEAEAKRKPKKIIDSLQ